MQKEEELADMGSPVSKDIEMGEVRHAVGGRRTDTKTLYKFVVCTGHFSTTDHARFPSEE